MDKQVIHPSEVPAARVPLSQAIKAGDWVSLERVVKVTIFPKGPPARRTFQCVGLVGDARVEIEAIAFAA